MCYQSYPGGVVALPAAGPHQRHMSQHFCMSTDATITAFEDLQGQTFQDVAAAAASASAASSAASSATDDRCGQYLPQADSGSELLSAASTSTLGANLSGSQQAESSCLLSHLPEQVQDDYAPNYISGTTLPVGGWFQSCRGCALKTAKEMSVLGRQIPVCLQCQEKWTCMARGDFPQGRHVPGVEPLSTWIPHAVPDPSAILTDEERRLKCESLLLSMDDMWQQLISTDS